VFRESLLVRASDFPLSDLVQVPLDEFVAYSMGLEEPLQALSFLFHLPFSASTILTRHLDASVVVIRDPVSLYALFVPAADDEPWPDNIAKLREATLRLLASSGGTSQSQLIRVGGSFPEMIEPLASSAYFGRALYVYASPVRFAVQVLKDPLRRRNLRVLMSRSRPAFVESATGCETRTLPDGALVGLLWIYTADAILACAARQPGRITSLDTDRILRGPQRAAAACVKWLGRIPSSACTRVSRNLTEIHAKTGEPFNPDIEKLVFQRLASHYASEIQSAQDMINLLDAGNLRLRALEALAVPDV
jgi:hypothetical protein